MGLKISRILHAGYVFECGDTQVAIDPIFENPFSRNCHAFPDVQFDHQQIRNLKLDAVFISHFHDDHCSLESLNFLNRGTPIYIYCLREELLLLIKELGFLKVYPLEIDTPIKIGSIEVIARRALDADVDSMFHVKAAGLNVLNVVDSWIDDETLQQLGKYSPWDMVLWPFQTMLETDVLAPSRKPTASLELPPEWIEQIKILSPKFIVPSSCQFVQESWSWYNHAMFPITYLQFNKEIEQALPRTGVIRLNPSISIELDKESCKMSTPLSWVIPVGNQDVDYQYQPDIKPPPTAEISQHFAPLSQQQTEEVLNYCRMSLIEKYNSMEPPLDIYFEKPRLWQLSIFDHKGSITSFHYRLANEKIELIEDHHGALSWTTEIPISKLYAALNSGESLTSLYMRINDTLFDEQTEKEIKFADIIEDPLTRCLFNGVAFASYQRAQLKRIQERG